MVGFARWGWVNTPAEQDQDVKGWTLGARYYPEMNVAVHLEYAKREVDHGADEGTSDLEETIWTLRADFAF
jgi:phosphate-selective porin